MKTSEPPLWTARETKTSHRGTNQAAEAAHLSRDEAAEVGVHVFHESHVEQRQARLHGSQDVCVTGQRMVPPLRLSPGEHSDQHIGEGRFLNGA